MLPYCTNYLNRSRLKTREVLVGGVGVGGSNPVRIQSMTTTNTLDTEASVEQSIRMINAGCEIVRLTAPSKKEAENLANIKFALRKKGYDQPLVADIHFTPNAAEIAADIVEKVRINPGNYADKKRFETKEYTDDDYNRELERIEEKFLPLLLKCKANNIALRIGTNHGSLSDRIMNRYGDTPKGMVESAMEFIRMCEKHEYYNIILSMKASNTLVMVEAYRLLVATMLETGNVYPLHLGVTEAGDGEDGRIKSAVGIGTLLEDGIGDTIRVSLTEEPEFEMPVAQKLLDKYNHDNIKEYEIKSDENLKYVTDPYTYDLRHSEEVINIGGHQNVPAVVADLSRLKDIKPSHLFAYGYTYNVHDDKWNISESAADIIYIGSNTLSFVPPGGLKVVVDYAEWNNGSQDKEGYFPLLNMGELLGIDNIVNPFFLSLNAEEDHSSVLKNYPNAIIILGTKYTNKTQLYRYSFLNFAKNNISNPVIITSSPYTEDVEQFQLWSSSELGSLLIDGMGDGIWLIGDHPAQVINSTSFGILQATRTRISKTEYISCPSCGRTLFDLQETTAKIRKRTSHLKGIKIGIMGCIVNGPGEMADADYGYVGTGPGKIHLYKEKTVVRKNVPQEDAVAALIDLIKENGDWVDPK